ncbi:MAG TPA: SxtJ family membrane protein, partial [Pyrinomonadaceae bacterium]
YRGRTTVVVIFGTLGGMLLVVGLLIPPAARVFHTSWMGLAALLGHVNSRVLLTLMYYLVVTPYGFVTRLAGRDPLRRRGAEAESYWVERKTTRQTREQFERLF